MGDARQPDCRHRFLIDSCDVRGTLVRLDDTWQNAASRSDYPPNVRALLGEAFVAASLIVSTIKFRGRLTLQLRGPGSVHMLVVQVSNEGELRGLARWQSVPDSTALAIAFGEDARMIIAIERDGQQPWQGIVPLAGDTLADALVAWFRTSEQLETDIHLQCRETGAEGLLLQRLPFDQRISGDDDGWTRATRLAATLTGEELASLDAATLLTRLYHEERVRLFEAEPLRFRCRCSAERTDNMLIGLGEHEVRDILAEEGRVEITCEFCDAVYRYDAVDIEALFKGAETHPETAADPMAAAPAPEDDAAAAADAPTRH
ncbi:MAG: redox-regulated molecular chaperone Hsp33 [Gammaproteobacteria bacterium]|nr:MAG: redox-regulated molecular chaperone Hsp33 [Gammaproteobacteria bacterium]PIE38603.1 MAG: redox-regulated molecular chaperone Hsp33 [Gammaproteobacteria bacterium]